MTTLLRKKIINKIEILMPCFEPNRENIYKETSLQNKSTKGHWHKHKVNPCLNLESSKDEGLSLR